VQVLKNFEGIALGCEEGNFPAEIIADYLFSLSQAFRASSSAMPFLHRNQLAR